MMPFKALRMKKTVVGGGGAAHTPVFFQGAKFSGDDAGDIAFVSDTQTGCTIVVLVADISNGSQAVTDNKGNTYTRLFNNTTAPALPAWGGPQIDAWICENANGGSGHIVSTTNMGGTSVKHALELRGSGGAPTLNGAKTTSGFDSATPYTLASATPINNSLLVTFCMADGYGAFTVGPSPLAMRTEEQDGGSYWTSSTATMVTGTSPVSVAWTMDGSGNGVMMNLIFE